MEESVLTASGIFSVRITLSMSLNGMLARAAATASVELSHSSASASAAEAESAWLGLATSEKYLRSEDSYISIAGDRSGRELTYWGMVSCSSMRLVGFKVASEAHKLRAFINTPWRNRELVTKRPFLVLSRSVSALTIPANKPIPVVRS